MNPAADRPEFSGSQKIYALLLRAYPRKHRMEYGAAMAQLFRDQCRDAWAEDRGWGLTKLWLRVLPDVVSTSITENLAAMKERKTMNDNLANLNQVRPASAATSFFTIFAIVFVLGTGWGVLCALILPPIYASTCKMKVEDKRVLTLTPTPETNAFHPDPYFILPEFEVIKSPLVLSNVIAKLDLNVEWGKKFFAGRKLETSETMGFLKKRIIVSPVRNTKLITITVESDDKIEAAEIANAVADAYKNYRIEYRGKFEANILAGLQFQYLSQSNQIAALCKEADGFSSQNPVKKKQLDELLLTHELLSSHITQEKLNARIPQTQPVQITDPAEPSHIPVKPNKTLDIVFGVMMGIVLGTLAGGLAVCVSTLRANRRKNAAVV